MVRINLLPAHIIERRRYERFYPYLFVGAAVLLGIVLALWGGMQFMVVGSNERLQRNEETVTMLNKQAAALRIFESQAQSLEDRRTVADSALSGRVDVGKIMEEVSLVLPDSLWIDSLNLSQETGLVMSGYTPDSAGAEIGKAYKSVAAGLVRLNGLDALKDVWLTSAAGETFTDFRTTTDSSSSPEALTVRFEITSKITTSVPDPQTTAVPAPPSTAGQ